MGNICNSATHTQKSTDALVPAILGDIGGTNMRLTLRRLNLTTRSSSEIIPLTIYPTNDYASLEECLNVFLKVSLLS